MEKPAFRTRNIERSRELRKSASPYERLLWSKLRNGQINGYRFTRQFQIGDFFADIVCRSEKKVVEVDGLSHDTQQDYDEKRDFTMRSLGYRVLRFTNDEVKHNLVGVGATIEQALTVTPSPNPSRLREGS